MTEIDSNTLLKAMKSRRTIRQFTDKPVEKEKIRQILEAGRFSPTGGNSQRVSYTILGSRQSKAESMGLGVLYSGFFISCTRISGKLRRLIKLPKGQKAFTCMIIGYPAVKYQRIVPRDGYWHDSGTPARNRNHKESRMR